MKKLLLVVSLLGACSPAMADTSLREMFKRTDGLVLDWAIASSVEAGYFRDLINGNNLAGAQFPVLYIKDVVTGDLGYVTGYDDKTPGTLMFGGSIRVNKIIEIVAPNKVAALREFAPVVDKVWEKLWFGPFIAKNFSEIDNAELMAGLKMGISW